jgi:hypothetical protein
MGHSFNEVVELLKNNFSKFIVFLIIQTFIQLIPVLGEAAGILPGTGTDIWIQILVGLLTVWNFCYLVQVYLQVTQKKEVDFFEQVLDATYDSFSFFLYSLLYGLTIMIGGFFLVLPGLYCLIFHYFAPFAAILKSDVNKGDDSYLSFSRKIVKPHWPSVVGFFVVMLFLNMIVMGVTALPFLSEVRIVLGALLSPLESFLIMLSDLLGIQLFHYLCKQYELNGENQL